MNGPYPAVLFSPKACRSTGAKGQSAVLQNLPQHVLLTVVVVAGTFMPILECVAGVLSSEVTHYH